MKELVNIENLNLTYQSLNSETIALQDINLKINKEEFISIVGPSGCGKTTILSLVSGILKATSGNVTVDGKNPNPKDDIQDIKDELALLMKGMDDEELSKEYLTNYRRTVEKYVGNTV